MYIEVRRAAAPLMAAFVLAGCAALEATDKKIDQAVASVDAMKELTQRNAQSAAIIHTKRSRLAGEEVVIKTNSLPDVFGKPVSYVTKGSQSLLAALEDISLSIGVPIKSSEIAQYSQLGQFGAAMGGGMNGQVRNTSTDGLSGNLVLEYSGNAKGLLDAIASKANVTWRYSAQRQQVEFFRYETKALSVYLPAGAKSIAASISLAGVTGGASAGGATGGGAPAGGGGSSASNAGNVSVSQTLNIDPWGSIMANVRAILTEGHAGGAFAASGAGMPAAAPAPASGSAGGSNVLSASGPSGTAIANPELGLVTITARPDAVTRIANYIESLNQRFAQNVLIDVKIYSVALDQQSSLGFNMNMLYNQVGRLGATLVGPGSMSAGDAAPGILTVTSKDPNNRWNGSTIVATALGQYGKVSLQKQGQVIAVNGQPAPIQVASEINYIASASTTTSPNVGATTSQTQGTKVVGFTANFLPLILGDNRILLQYQMQISQLSAPLTPNAAGVQTPQIASQSLQQQAFLRDGQAIVLFGFDDQSDSSTSSTNLGGWSRAAQTQRSMTVIVMQVNAGGIKDERS